MLFEDDIYELHSHVIETSIGGSKFDELLVKYCIETFKQKEGIDIA